MTHNFFGFLYACLSIVCWIFVQFKQFPGGLELCFCIAVSVTVVALRSMVGSYLQDLFLTETTLLSSDGAVFISLILLARQLCRCCTCILHCPYGLSALSPYSCCMSRLSTLLWKEREVSWLARVSLFCDRNVQYYRLATFLGFCVCSWCLCCCWLYFRLCLYLFVTSVFDILYWQASWWVEGQRFLI